MKHSESVVKGSIINSGGRPLESQVTEFTKLYADVMVPVGVVPHLYIEN